MFLGTRAGASRGGGDWRRNMARHGSGVGPTLDEVGGGQPDVRWEPLPGVGPSVPGQRRSLGGRVVGTLVDCGSGGASVDTTAMSTVTTTKLPADAHEVQHEIAPVLKIMGKRSRFGRHRPPWGLSTCLQFPRPRLAVSSYRPTLASLAHGGVRRPLPDRRQADLPLAGRTAQCPCSVFFIQDWSAKPSARRDVRWQLFNESRVGLIEISSGGGTRGCV